MIDTHGGIGVLGVATGWGLAEYHLIAATTAAVLTSAYMAYILNKKFRD